MAACTVSLSHSLPDGDQCLMLPQESVETASEAVIVPWYSSAVSKAEKSSFIPVSFPNILLKCAGSLAFV